MTQKGIEKVDCFFCGKKDSCLFKDGKGYVVLGGSDHEFGNHAMCVECSGRLPEAVCRACGGPINKETDKTFCGYGKCVECCDKQCNHRTHPNPKFKCKCPEGYHTLFTECRGY